MSELATFIFGLSSQEVRLQKWGKGPSIDEEIFMKNMSKCLTLLTKSLLYNGLESLEDLYATPLDLVSDVHKSYAHGGYLPLLMVGVIISVNKYLTMAQYYLVLSSLVDMNRVLLKIYLSLW